MHCICTAVSSHVLCHLLQGMYLYVCDFERERETSVDAPSREHGVPPGSLSGSQGFDAAPAVSSHTKR